MKLSLQTFVFLTLFHAMYCKLVPMSSKGAISPYLKFIVTVDGKSYFADNTSRSWFDSKHYCNSLGMKMATITTKNQVDALQDAYDSVDFNQEYWLSGRDAHLPRQFSWDLTGEEVVAEYIRFEDRNHTFLNCLIYRSRPDSFLRYYECRDTIYVKTLCET